MRLRPPRHPLTVTRFPDTTLFLSTWCGRAKLLWAPGTGTTVTLASDFNGRNSTAPAFRNIGLNALGINVTGQIIALGGDPDRDIVADIDPNLTTRAWGTSLTVAQDLGFASLKSITAYRHSRSEERRVGKECCRTCRSRGLPKP